MADAEVTEEQLAKGNEPEFNEALSAKKTAETDSAKAPAKGRAAENQQLTTAKAGAAASGAAAMNALTATRAQAGQKVDGGKGETKSKDEKKRADVTAKLQKVYDGTKKDVEATLSGLDKKVDAAFTSGEKAARDAFTADHKRRMKKYKDKRYSGWTGKARWVKDKFAGLPEEANSLYQEARKLYVSQMQTVISSVADIIGTELGKAKARIAKGRGELKAEVDKLPADLRQFGEDAAKDFAGKFDDLEASVNEKSEQLVQDLAQKYTAALNKVDEEIKKLQEANKGLIDKAKDAIVGAIKTINELKNLLLGILAKAMRRDHEDHQGPHRLPGQPGVGRRRGPQPLRHEHRRPPEDRGGVVAARHGGEGGPRTPQKFDMKGIIQLIGSLLGLTWANIRARVTRKGVPDQAMTAVESSVPVAQNIAREGPADAVKEIQEEAGDLKSTILEKLTSYLIPTVIIAGITWILSLLNPASAFVRAVKGIIDIVTFVVNQGAQIVEFVNSVLDAVVAIANGGKAGVPKMVETALAASVPLLIGFLASLLGIGSLAAKVKSVFHAVSRPVNRAVDKIVNFIAKKGKALWNKLKKNKRTDKGKNKAPGDKDGQGGRKTVRVPFHMQGQLHHLVFTPPRRLLMASTPQKIHTKASETIKALEGVDDPSGRTAGRIAELQHIVTLSDDALVALELFGGDETDEDVKRELDALRTACEGYARRHDVKDIDPDAESKEKAEKRWREIVDRAKHVAPRNYSDAKHWKGKNDAQRRDASKNGGAGQFIFSLTEARVVELERETLLGGERVDQGGGTYHAFKEFGEQIGWSNNEEAKWLRAEITDLDPEDYGKSTRQASVHSHPRLTRNG